MSSLAFNFNSSVKLSRQVFYNSCEPELMALQSQIDRLALQQEQVRKFGPLFARKVKNLESRIIDARLQIAVALNRGINS
jgi:hypothetical protein